MCLYNILGEPEQTSGIGYKAFIITSDGNLCFPFYNPDGAENDYSNRVIIELHKKYKSVKNVEQSNNGEPYKTGFHIFLTQKSAREFGSLYGLKAIAKVRYEKARLVGTQVVRWGYTANKVKCIIADEITLLEIINN